MILSVSDYVWEDEKEKDPCHWRKLDLGDSLPRLKDWLSTVWVKKTVAGLLGALTDQEQRNRTSFSPCLQRGGSANQIYLERASQVCLERASIHKQILFEETYFWIAIYYWNFNFRF